MAERSPDALRSVVRRLADEPDAAALTVRILEGADELFGASSSLCAVIVDGSVRVAQFRGLAPDRLVEASRHEAFRSFLSADDLRVDSARHPVVAMLASPGEAAVGLPLRAGGRRLGQLVVFLGGEPAPADRTLLETFASHAAVCLLAARLRASNDDHEQRLASFTHAVTQPVVLVDEQGRLADANGAAAAVFHLAPGFDRGYPVAGRLGHPALERMLASGRETGAEVVLGTDQPRVYRASVRRLRGAGGRVTGRALILHDVTVEREVDALKDDLVAVVGHELRTPVTVVKGYVRTLARQGASMSEERRAKALAAVASNVERLERLIEDLLFLSAVQERPAKIDLRRQDLAQVLRRYERDRVTVSVPDRPVELAVDDERLDKVLRHLLDNALEYSDGPVVVELVDRGDGVAVSVSDQGPGIFSGDLPHLFERFRQLDGSATRSHPGLGIGLYLCRRVVEALGGRIWCDSRLGVGTRFTFFLPRDERLPQVS